MQRQGSFSQAEYAGKKKQTRRDKFLAEMEQVVPWARLVERLQPHYPKGERGRRVLAKAGIGLERMLRLYFVQQWYGLAPRLRACEGFGVPGKSRGSRGGVVSCHRGNGGGVRRFGVPGKSRGSRGDQLASRGHRRRPAAALWASPLWAARRLRSGPRS
jgi:hypothetical protein